jgi:hypothetical protein
MLTSSAISPRLTVVFPAPDVGAAIRNCGMFFMMSVLVSANIDIIFEKQSSSCIKKDRETVRP